MTEVGPGECWGKDYLLQAQGCSLIGNLVAKLPFGETFGFGSG